MTDTARVFTDVRDFPVYISHMDDQTRIWFAPYRIWDGTVAVLGLAGTAAAMYHWLGSGHVLLIGLLGGAGTFGATWLARLMPISRPSVLYRLWWLVTVLFASQKRAAIGGARRDPWLSPPKAVIDNLVFTHGGVWAEFLLAGQPGGMLPYDRKRAIAKAHRPLVRQLPPGFVLWGACVRVNPRRIKQRMLAGYEGRPAWVGEVRAWEDQLDQEPHWEMVFGLRVPVDAGMAGRSSTGGLAQTWKKIVGADPDNENTLAGHRAFADEIRAKIPAQFEPTPATPRQIRWLYDRHLTRGADDGPFPHGPGGPERLAAADFGNLPADFDEGDQQGRRTQRSWWRRHLPSLTPLLRIDTGSGQSYQALLPVEQLPRQGLAYPGAEYLLSVYDVHLDAAVDWFHHVDIQSREKALARVDRAQRNLDDQSFQRAGRRASDNDLMQRFASGEDYNTELEASSLERETGWTTVIAVGSASAQATTLAARALRTHLGEELETTVGQPVGAQRALWQIGATGSEQRAPASQYIQPTTTKHWARFAPLASAELGNTTGILLGRNLSTLRPSPVFVDLEGSTERRDAPGMLWIGPPGGGKSQGVKRIVDGLIKRGSQVSIIDPGTMREWAAALTHHGDRVAVIDPTTGAWSLDPLRLFPRQVAVEHTLDHLLPMIGLEPDSVLAGQLSVLLRDEQIGSLGALLRHLNGSPAHTELAAKLNAWAQVDYLRAVFDDTLPIPPIGLKDAVIWLTADLELPTTSDTDNVHLYQRQSRRARAGLAVYGLIASLTRLTYTGPDRRGGFGWLVCEEARTYLRSPVGREDAHRIVTQGRKEHYGLIAISQFIEDFAGIPTQALPMRVITPFKATERDYARATFTKMGINPDEYPDVLETRTVPGHGYAYFIDHAGRAGLVDLLPPVQQELRDAFDTRHLGELS